MVLKHYTQRTLISNIKNLWYQFRAWQRSNKDTEQAPGPATPPSDYNLVFQDNFTELNWEHWRTGHPWGRNVHPDWQWKWWPHRSELTKYQVVYPTPEGLALELRNFPRIFKRVDLPEWQRKGAQLSEWKADYCMGCISSRETYTHGWFEAEIKVPSGRGQWAAFWLSGSENWPPEIDIFETYKREDQVEPKPNVHFGTGKHWKEGKRDMGAPRIHIKSPEERWIKYAVHWTGDFIRFYYDGHLVQEMTIPAALKQNSQSQYIILNNGCENPDELKFNPDESGMLVRSIKVYQKNK